MEMIIRDDYDDSVKPSEPLTEAQKKFEFPTVAGRLYPGDRFEIIALKNFYRNLYVTSISDCSVTIKGEYRHHKDEPFRPLNRGWTISLNTPVIRI